MGSIGFLLKKSQLRKVIILNSYPLLFFWYLEDRSDCRKGDEVELRGDIFRVQNSGKPEVCGPERVLPRVLEMRRWAPKRWERNGTRERRGFDIKPG